MDLVTIFNQLLRWGGFALIGGSAFLLLAAAGYFIYKKVLHGKKVLTKPQAVSVVLLGCWMFLVVGLTSLSRGANFTGSLNLDFLSGYINAWNNWSISELQLILFNMLMFAPLGFLLPLLWKKAEKFWVTLAISLTLTACLESVQFLTGTGIFELDDLFHNLLGSLFGYFCIMAILTTIREKALRFAPMARVLLIPGVIGLGLGAVFCVYNHQPYGNMDILPAVKQDLSAVEIVTQCQLGEHNADVEHGASHGGGGVELLRRGDELHLVFSKSLNHSGEVQDGAADTIQLIADHSTDLTPADCFQHFLKLRTVCIFPAVTFIRKGFILSPSCLILAVFNLALNRDAVLAIYGLPAIYRIIFFHTLPSISKRKSRQRFHYTVTAP